MAKVCVNQKYWCWLSHLLIHGHLHEQSVMEETEKERQWCHSGHSAVPLFLELPCLKFHTGTETVTRPFNCSTTTTTTSNQFLHDNTKVLQVHILLDEEVNGCMSISASDDSMHLLHCRHINADSSECSQSNNQSSPCGNFLWKGTQPPMAAVQNEFATHLCRVIHFYFKNLL